METSESVTPFAEALEAVDRLTVEEQEELTDIVRRRLAERGRQRVVGDVLEGERELQAGGCRPVAVDDLLREILS